MRDTGETIRTIQLCTRREVRHGGDLLQPLVPEFEKTVLFHPIRLCLVKQAWYLIARPDGRTDL